MKIGLKQRDKRLGGNIGFTLIEIMVSVGIFSVIMVLGIGALVNVTNAYKVAQQQKTALDSLSFVIESMSRDIRTGSDYYSGIGSGSSQTPQDGTASSISFNASDGRGYFSYYVNNNILYRQINGGTAEPLTSGSDISIGSGTDFTVIGSDKYSTGDTYQPSVWINVQGSLVADSEKSFLFQTLVSQRKLDF